MTSDDLTESLTQFGLTPDSSAVYLQLLTMGATSKQGLLKNMRLAPERLDGAIERLHSLYLVGRQVFRSRERFYATNPQIVWRWQELEFAWMNVTDVAPSGVPAALVDTKAEARRQLIVGIQRHAATLYAHKPFTSVEVKRYRAYPTPDEYAHGCAEAILLAKSRVVSFDKPPQRVPHLALYWASILDRRAAGIAYTRCVPFDEILNHGVEIVERDVFQMGIEIKFISSGSIDKGYYLIDADYLLMRDPEPIQDRHFGELIRAPMILDRYVRRSETLIARAVAVRDVWPEILVWRENKMRAVEALYPGGAQAAVARKVSSLGRFARLDAHEQAIARDLIRDGIFKNAALGGYTLTLPTEAPFASFL